MGGGGVYIWKTERGGTTTGSDAMPGYVEGGYSKEVCTVLFIDKTSESCVIIKIFFKH